MRRNYHKLSSSKQCPFVKFQFCRWDNGVGSSAVCLEPLQSLKWVLAGQALIWRIWRRIHFQLLQGAGKIQFLVLGAPRSVSEVTGVNWGSLSSPKDHSFSHGPLQLQTNHTHLALLVLQISLISLCTFLLYCMWTKFLAFRGSCN